MKPFEIRGFNPCESLLRHSPEQLTRFIRRMKTLNMNTIIIHYDYGWKRYQDLIIKECQDAGVKIILMTFGPRTFLSYSDWKTQWFAKDLNGNPFCQRLECETYPCAFEPEALAAYEYGAKQWLHSLPSAIKHVHMRAADGLMFCQCEKCRPLPDHEKWQPFVEIFTRAVLAERPDLKFETDIYVKRYNIPQNRQPFHQMSNIMYDTFYRTPQQPIGCSRFPNLEMTGYAATEKNPDAVCPNQYHLNRLKEWTTEYPGKVYIHENAMAQGLCGVFQHGTWSYLRDLELYRELGIQGVCYEAYEPGYCHFSDMFEILAKAMMGEEIDYQPTKLEQVINGEPYTGWFGRTPPEDWMIPFITDPRNLKLHQLIGAYNTDPCKQTFRNMLTFAVEHKDVLDPLFIADFHARGALRRGLLDKNDLSEVAQDMLSRRKLWDFMEEIPMEDDPIKVCLNIIGELIEKAK